MNEHEKIENLMKQFGEALSEKEVEKAEAIRQQLIQQIDSSIATVSRTPPYDNNFRYQQATIKLFGVYKSIAEMQYRDLIEILSKKHLLEEDFRKYENILNQINMLEMIYDEQYAQIQQEYAEKYKLKLFEYKIIEVDTPVNHQ